MLCRSHAPPSQLRQQEEQPAAQGTMSGIQNMHTAHHRQLKPHPPLAAMRPRASSAEETDDDSSSPNAYSESASDHRRDTPSAAHTLYYCISSRDSRLWLAYCGRRTVSVRDPRSVKETPSSADCSSRRLRQQRLIGGSLGVWSHASGARGNAARSEQRYKSGLWVRKDWCGRPKSCRWQLGPQDRSPCR